MISVIIPTLNHQAHLAGNACRRSFPRPVEGLVREVIIVDGGSTDRTLEIADGSGADIVTSEAGRGAQLKAGAERARQPWLFFSTPTRCSKPGGSARQTCTSSA